nr:SpoIIIAH-like family protein [Ectobacillus ponti]
MLSLVVVLSVYYVTTPDSPRSNVASTVEQAAKKGASKETAKSSGSDMFVDLRLQMDDQRSAMKAELRDMMTSGTATAEQKNEAYQKIQQIQEMEAKEKLLETLIKSKVSKDALVRAESNSVKVTLKSEKQSASEANTIIQLVRGETGIRDVNVQFDPAK